MRGRTVWARNNDGTEITQVLAAATAERRPIYGAKEVRNPANQWLANHLARNRLHAERVMAGEWARVYVQAAMDFTLTRDDLWAMRRRFSAMGRQDLVEAVKRGMDTRGQR